ncbi:MAG: glycosyltransferase family 2 protein [Pseudomonadota bacterium]
MSITLEFSVIVPVLNEAGNVDCLVAEIATALDGRSYEMIFVDDASTDDTFARLVALKSSYPALRVLHHRNNSGQSRAIRSGLEVARGRVIGLLDGDGQNNPSDLPDLYRQLTRTGAPEFLALIMGERTNRQDSPWKIFGSRLGNAIRRSILKDNSRDSACGIKVMHADIFRKLPYFDHMHRYMPALVQAEGYTFETRPVSHRARETGKTKYTNIGRLADGWSDLRSVAWLMKRRRHPGSVEEAS